VARNHAPERPRDPTGRHDDRSAGSLLDWDRANRVTPGKLRIPGSADLGLSFLLTRKASAASGAPEGVRASHSARLRRKMRHSIRSRLSALRSPRFRGARNGNSGALAPYQKIRADGARVDFAAIEPCDKRSIHRTP